MSNMHPDNEFETRIKRLYEVVGARNDSDLARALGIKPQSIGPARKRQQIPPRWIRTVSEKFNASTDWLFFGHGKPFVDDVRGAAAGSAENCPHCAAMKKELAEEQRERRETNAELMKISESMRHSIDSYFRLQRENNELKDKVHKLEIENLKLLSAAGHPATKGRKKPVQSMSIVHPAKNTLQEKEEF